MSVKRKRTELGMRFDVAVKELGEYSAKVGWFATSKYPDGTLVAYVASIMEFGAAEQGIPPRPYIRPTIASRQGDWRKLMGQGATACLKGRVTALQVFEGLALQAEGDTRLTISQVTTPAIADSTKASRLRRGNSSVKPLVDRRYLINTLTSVTEKK